MESLIFLFGLPVKQPNHGLLVRERWEHYGLASDLLLS
jgi:hypothetical protein